MNLFQRLFSLRVLPSWTIMLFDTILVILSVLIAFALRYSLGTLSDMGTTILISIALAVAVNWVFFALFHTFSGVLRLSSFVDVMHIFVSLTLAFAVCIVACAVSEYIFNFSLCPISVLLIAYVVTFVLMSTLRMTIKTIFDQFNEEREEVLNTFIYGTQAGINIAKSLRMTSNNRFHISGFIADELHMGGKVLMGCPVFLNDESLMEHLRDKKVRAVIISPYKADKIKETDLADKLLDMGINIFMAPEVTDDWDGIKSQAAIKPVKIEDLLGRDPIHVNMQKISSHLMGKRVLITGAAGSIGSEIMRQVVRFNPFQLILIDQAETPLHDIRMELKNNWSEIEAPTLVADITNRRRMEEIFERYRPEYVFHAAAYKHVPMMEDNVSESIQNNVLGTKILADLSVKFNVQRFVMVSTDKAVNPTNVMGCSKRICEIYVQALGKTCQTQFVTTRFGNVLGSNGSVIPLFKEQIRNGGPVTVTDEHIVRYSCDCRYCHCADGQR